ncbi:ABC transporter ATP-binding protein [Williamsia herbipolensis]|uniref:ABC transporter ATP-binding protein n=1 Tax=Williamsia herbipolensis TaxID=1603258 RepID=UPI0005F891FF|nr:ATP-binding cassette domain-containing protein [Williamsia herbipolensis]
MLHIDRLCLSAGDSDLFTDLTLHLEAGRCLAVTGANGSGKSTLLRAIAGLRHPDSGTVTLRASTTDDVVADDTDSRFRALVAVELGDDATFAELTVAEHLRLLTSAHGAGGGAVADILSDAGIDHLADRFPHTLSTGQRQRFTLCAVWIRPARLIVLDEPEAGLDVAGRDWVAHRIERTVAEGRSVVVATHSAELVERCADSTVTVGR